MCTPLVTCPTGTSASGQRGNSGWKSLAAHLAVQAADAVDRAAAADGEIGHVERLGVSWGFARPSASRSSTVMPKLLLARSD